MQNGWLVFAFCNCGMCLVFDFWMQKFLYLLRSYIWLFMVVYSKWIYSKNCFVLFIDVYWFFIGSVLFNFWFGIVVFLFGLNVLCEDHEWLVGNEKEESFYLLWGLSVANFGIIVLCMWGFVGMCIIFYLKAHFNGCLLIY